MTPSLLYVTVCAPQGPTRRIELGVVGLDTSPTIRVVASVFSQNKPYLVFFSSLISSSQCCVHLPYIGGDSTRGEELGPHATALISSCGSIRVGGVACKYISTPACMHMHSRYHKIAP